MSFFGGGRSRGRTDAGPNRTTATKLGVGTINESGKVVGSFFQTEGAHKSNRDIDKLPLSGTKIIATALKGPLAKGAKYSRSFFENMVIGNTKKGSNIKTTSKEFNAMTAAQKETLYSGYVKARQSGEKDAYGRDPVPGGDGREEGIELAKSATGSATILGPAEIQKTAANNKGTTDTTMTAAQTNIANKRKGKKATNQTAKKVLTEDYKLSKKILLG